jgi:hypothetical protein
MFHRYIYFKISAQAQLDLLAAWRELIRCQPGSRGGSGSSHVLERRCDDELTWMEVYRNYPSLRALDEDQEEFDVLWVERLRRIQTAPVVERHVETFRSCA